MDPEAVAILELLNKKKNVLLLGAPGTGKSLLMNEIANLFENTVNNESQGIDGSHPMFYPEAAVPIPASKQDKGDNPLLSIKNRKVFRTSLHQNSKYRDFLNGIIPEMGTSGAYKISEGILYRANEFSKQSNSAALLIIDELNRGPAVEVFGGSIVAIEPDKRLAEDNSPKSTTQYFEIMTPPSGDTSQYAFSSHLYILAAMNQADVSVAPLDTAFLRRWQSYKLRPKYEVLYDAFNVKRIDTFPNECNSASDIYNVAFHALEKINYFITISRGEDYQLGQGVFFSTKPDDNSLSSALNFVTEVWSMIFTHIEELFFGDIGKIAYILNAESAISPYNIEMVSFVDEEKPILKHEKITADTIYDLYRAIAEKE